MKIAEITRHVARAFSTTPEAIKGRSRKRSVVVARQCVMFLAHRQPGNSLTKIGRELGRDHTTVMSGVRDYPQRAQRYGYASQAMGAVAAVTGAKRGANA